MSPEIYIYIRILKEILYYKKKFENLQDEEEDVQLVLFVQQYRYLCTIADQLT